MELITGWSARLSQEYKVRSGPHVCILLPSDSAIDVSGSDICTALDD